MTTKFVPNPEAATELARATEMQAFLLKVASEVADRVREIGPKDDDADPHYVDDITVEVGEVEPGRFGARVNANKYTSNWIEFGTGGDSPTPAFAPLRKALEAAGFTLVEVKR